MLFYMQQDSISCSRTTWLACSSLPFSDGCGEPCNHVVSSPVSEGDLKGLQETDLPAIYRRVPLIRECPSFVRVCCQFLVTRDYRLSRDFL